MTNRFDRAAARLDARLLSHASSLVTYTRPSTNKSVQLLAAKGRTPYQIDNGTGVLVSFESKDFIVSASQLILDGVAVVPVKEDIITDGGRTFKVSDMEQGNCYQSVDLDLRYRIHTKVTGP